MNNSKSCAQRQGIGHFVWEEMAERIPQHIKTEPNRLAQTTAGSVLDLRPSGAPFFFYFALEAHKNVVSSPFYGVLRTRFV